MSDLLYDARPWSEVSWPSGRRCSMFEYPDYSLPPNAPRTDLDSIFVTSPLLQPLFIIQCFIRASLLISSLIVCSAVVPSCFLQASCYSHMGKQKNIITRTIVILAMWFIEQKAIIFRCRTNIRDEPAPAMTLFDGLFLKCVKRYELETFT